MLIPKTARKRFGAFHSKTVLHDLAVMVFFLISGTLLCELLNRATENILNVSFIYILIIVAIARFTTSYIYGIISSVISIICINYFFTYPFLHLNFTLSGYPVAFFSMLLISSLTSATTTSLKKQSLILAEREKALAAAEKEKMRANLLRAISHDLRTPLTSIIGSANICLENAQQLTEADRLSLIRNIQEDANWLLNMVENILTVTRIHTEGAKVTKSLEPVEEVASAAVMRLKKRLPDAQIHVRVPEEFLMIPMDAILIEQVILNLLENAVVHSGSIKPIEFYVTCDEESVCFHVRDHGVGIPPDRLSEIFDGTGSSQAQNSDSYRGMGIGLSICKTIIDAHEGIIAARNITADENHVFLEDGRKAPILGAEFYFTLPRGELIT